MKYYVIAGEASGDLHASRLIHSLKLRDPEAQFRGYGGEMMEKEGTALVKNYSELAYMGFIPVLLHLPTILRNLSRAKKDIVEWHADAVILVDYPGFNLKIAKFLCKHTVIPCYYYIAPKIWAWKEYRIKNIKRDVDELFSILPFEKAFYEEKHGYRIHYVGNPTAEEVISFRQQYREPKERFCHRYNMNAEKPIIALLAGSRRQEIKDNLPTMLKAAANFEGKYQLVLAGAPGISRSYYDRFLKGTNVVLADNETYKLLTHSHAALVTSGTATLETALFGVPQVVCYETPLPHIIGYLKKKVLKVPYVSLVNLIAGRKVVTELVADTFNETNIRTEMRKILAGEERETMLNDYREVWERLGKQSAPEETARLITDLLNGKYPV